jgi:hypothetical protein
MARFLSFAREAFLLDTGQCARLSSQSLSVIGRRAMKNFS